MSIKEEKEDVNIKQEKEIAYIKEKIEEILHKIDKSKLSKSELYLYKILNYLNEPEVKEMRIYATFPETGEISPDSWFIPATDTKNYFLKQCIKYFEEQYNMN